MTEWRREERTLRLLNAAQTVPFEITFLDDALIGMMPIDLLLVGARTGRGKTALLTQLALNQASKSRRVLFFALEADKFEIQRRILYRKMSQLFFQNLAGASPFRFPRYREWLAGVGHEELATLEEQAYQELRHTLEDLTIVYCEKRMGVKKFSEMCEYLRSEYDVIIVDHFHYFIFEGNDVDGVKRAIGQIRDLHLETGKPIILAAQLRKTTGAASKALPDIDDFHGHSDLAKIATMTLLLSPAPQDVAGNALFPTWFHCGKSRTASETLPYVGLLTWDSVRNNYSKRYFVGKYSQFDQPELISAQSELPDWAKNAQLAPSQEPSVYRGGKHGRDYD